ncbi:hypothetical protein [Streptomyces sp. NPDC060027]
MALPVLTVLPVLVFTAIRVHTVVEDWQARPPAKGLKTAAATTP